MSLAMQTQIKTRVFAEFRPNINIVAITISLATPATRSTLSRLSKDRSQFCVQHSDEEFTISIPAEVSSQADQRSYGSFQPEERVVARELPRFTQATVHQTFVPWSAPALGNEIELICQSCNSTILPRETVKIWKDLPSEGWAEMMDLWHCHKPNEHDHGDGNATASKGYSASSKLTAKSETGFVDVMSFLFTKGDCTGVQVAVPKNDNEVPSVLCTTCNKIIGFKDDQAEGLRLHKMSLALSYTALAQPESFEPAEWLSCHLLSAIETQGVRKFIFSTLPYEIWVFSSDVCYSSLVHPKPTRGIKVYFRATKQNAADIDTLKAQNLHIETLTLPARLEQMLFDLLQQSNESLPEKVATFLDWKVGFLPKFTREDVNM